MPGAIWPARRRRGRRRPAGRDGNRGGRRAAETRPPVVAPPPRMRSAIRAWADIRPVHREASAASRLPRSRAPADTRSDPGRSPTPFTPRQGPCFPRPGAVRHCAAAKHKRQTCWRDERRRGRPAFVLFLCPAPGGASSATHSPDAGSGCVGQSAGRPRRVRGRPRGLAPALRRPRFRQVRPPGVLDPFVRRSAAVARWITTMTTLKTGPRTP
jgi:hypothetical protein